MADAFAQLWEKKSSRNEVIIKEAFKVLARHITGEKVITVHFAQLRSEMRDTITANNVALDLALRHAFDDLREMDFNIVEGAGGAVAISKQDPPYMHVIVKCLDGVELTIRCEPVDDFNIIKQQIARKTEHKVDQMRLFHGGRQLEDGRTISDYDIQRGGVLRMVLRLRGD